MRFELADGATIFLDEVGDMSPKVQAKVLRVLEEQSSGLSEAATQSMSMFALSRPPTNAWMLRSNRGNFRVDLFYRLNVIPFELPPLPERLEDVPLLVEYFNSHFSQAYGKKPKQFLPEAVEEMQSYSWPGNGA